MSTLRGEKATSAVSLVGVFKFAINASQFQDYGGADRKVSTRVRREFYAGAVADERRFKERFRKSDAAGWPRSIRNPGATKTLS